MNFASLRVILSVAIAGTLLLAGCTPTTSGPTSGSSGTPSVGSASGCEVFKDQTDPELKLFTSSAISEGPAADQVYGDGTTFSVTLSKEAMDADLLPQFDIISLSSAGAPALVSSLAFDPTTGGDGTFSTSTLEFGNDELVGKAVIAEIYAISDGMLDGAQRYGQKLLLGNYCITYGNDGS